MKSELKVKVMELIRLITKNIILYNFNMNRLIDKCYNHKIQIGHQYVHN